LANNTFDDGNNSAHWETLRDDRSVGIRKPNGSGRFRRNHSMMIKGIQTRLAGASTRQTRSAVSLSAPGQDT
jgi:hypothetical protein